MVMNPLAGFQQGMEASDAFVRRTMEGLARNRASGALARGDYGAAAETYGRYGMGDQAMQLRDRQMEIDRLARRDTMAEQDRAMALEDRQRRIALDEQDRAAKALAAQQQAEAEALNERKGQLLNIMQGLRRAPMAQRAALLNSLAGQFQAMGVPAEMLGTLDQNALSDQEIDAAIAALGGELPNPRVLQSGRMFVGVDPTTGAQLFDGELPQDPLDAQYRQAQIAATQARAGASQASAQASMARAGATTAASRRAGAGGAPRAVAAPAGGPKPWQRNWGR